MKHNPFKLEKVAVRLVEEPPLLLNEPLNEPEKVVAALAKEIKQYDREVIAILNMCTDSKPINMTIASIGQVESAIACPRDLLKASILSNASGIIMLHNHPSGNLNPSYQDIMLTDKMKVVCDLVGITLLDHIIVGRDEEFFSFKENDKMPYTSFHLAKNREEIVLGEVAEKSRKSTLDRLEEAIKQSKESGYIKRNRPARNSQKQIQERG